MASRGSGHNVRMLVRLAFLSVCGACALGCGGSDGAAPDGGAGAASSSGSKGGASAGTSSGGQPSTGGEATMGGSSGAATGGAAGAPSSGAIECRARGDDKSTITLINRCAKTLSFRGSDIEGGELAPGEHACRDVGNARDEIPAIRYWGFIGEDPGGEKHTLAELTLNTSFNDFDWYNISHVDAHNLPMRVEAIDMPDCRVLTCAESLLEGCPAEGRLEDASGKLISCFSPHRDDPNSTVARYFEASCDDAYSWSGDDSESVAACAGEDYDVVFCP